MSAPWNVEVKPQLLFSTCWFQVTKTTATLIFCCQYADLIASMGQNPCLYFVLKLQLLYLLLDFLIFFQILDRVNFQPCNKGCQFPLQVTHVVVVGGCDRCRFPFVLMDSSFRYRIWLVILLPPFSLTPGLADLH